MEGGGRRPSQLKPRLLFNKIIFKLSRSLFEFKFYNIIARLQLGQEIAISHEEHLKNLYIISCRARPGGGVRPGMTSVLQFLQNREHQISGSSRKSIFSFLPSPLFPCKALFALSFAFQLLISNNLLLFQTGPGITDCLP